MATRQITVTLGTIGATAGPFNISDNVLGVIAMNVTRSELLAGYVVSSDVNATSITVTSIGVCTNSTTIYLSTPTPFPTFTPTPTGGPTATPTPTPTATPVALVAQFDSNYTGYSNICGSGGKVWSRLIAPAGSTVILNLNAYHYINNIAVGAASACISGVVYETSLPAIAPANGSSVISATATVLAANIPNYLSTFQVATITMPGTGYQDLILVYTTKNLTTNFTSGQARLSIYSVNGTIMSPAPGISTGYICSDSGFC